MGLGIFGCVLIEELLDADAMSALITAGHKNWVLTVCWAPNARGLASGALLGVGVFAFCFAAVVCVATTSVVRAPYDVVFIFFLFSCLLCRSCSWYG